MEKAYYSQLNQLMEKHEQWQRAALVNLLHTVITQR